jgi:hypothetical protein
MKVFFAVLFLSLLCACSASTSETANKPTPTPTPTKEEIAQQKADTEKAKATAITTFVETQYKGWAMQGIAAEDSFLLQLPVTCEESKICDLHLVKGEENKVVSVLLKHFFKTDGSDYWFVFEARSIDIEKAKIEQIKEREKDTVLENLDDYIQDDRDPGDYDPRG